MILAASLFVLVVFLVVAGVTASHLHEAAYHDYAASKHEAARKDHFQRQCAGITDVVELRRCFEEQIKSGWDTRHTQEDLYAQKEMADWAFWMMVITGVVGIPTTALTFVGVVLIYRNLQEARAATTAAIKAAEAGLDASKAAHRQADVAVQLEAARVIVVDVDLLHNGAGCRSKPMEGCQPSITFRNLGKTDAFVMQTCILGLVSPTPPNERRPLHGIQAWPPGTRIPPGDVFRAIGAPIADATAADGRKTHLWVYGHISFKDWFGNERQEPFMLYWWPDRPGGHPNRPAKFIPHYDPDQGWGHR